MTIPVLEGGGNSDGRREMVDLIMSGVIHFAIVNYIVLPLLLKCCILPVEGRRHPTNVQEHQLYEELMKRNRQLRMVQRKVWISLVCSGVW